MFKNILVPIVDDMVTPKTMKRIADLVQADGASLTLAYVSDPRAPFLYAKKASDYKISDANHKKACDKHATELLATAIKLLGKDLKIKRFMNLMRWCLKAFWRLPRSQRLMPS